MSDTEISSSPEFSPLAFGEDLAPLPEYKEAGDTQVDFSGLLDEPLKLHEDLKSGCGGQLWPAGMVLAKHMLRYQRDKLQPARILELGAGGGVVGLTIAKGCVKLDHPLYLTDILELEPLMQHNISLNGLDDRVRARVQVLCESFEPREGKSQDVLGASNRVVGWFGGQLVLTMSVRCRGEPLSQEVVEFKPDIILAADCVYFEPAFPLLMQTLQDLLALVPSATIFFCFKKRRRADMQFIKAAKKAFTVTEIEDEDRPVFSRNGLFLYTFTHK